MTRAYAPGKVILVGEHAVVYDRAAIAVPVTEVQACVSVTGAVSGQGLVIEAPDLNRKIILREAPQDEPLAHIVRSMLVMLGGEDDPDLTITVSSTVPVARGMGSGAAVSTAIVRALAKHYAYWMPSRAVSDVVYRTEVLHHGTPSGIDNTVVAYEKPVYFIKSKGWEVFWVKTPLLLAIADTGIESSTREVVGDLRRRYQGDPERYEPLFERVGELANEARSAIEGGKVRLLGDLMNENHALLQEMGVSCPELDRLVAAAREGGALGAKLSGGGWGGNAIALITEDTRGRVDMILRLAGATRVVVTKVR
jgi:mevalonate kinase